MKFPRTRFNLQSLLCVCVLWILVYLELKYKQSYVKYSNQTSAENLMSTVVLLKLTHRWWTDENPSVGLSNLTQRWRESENLTVLLPYLAQRRPKNGNLTVVLPTLILRWFNVVKHSADLQPTISTFYRRWFDVTLLTNSIFWNNSHHYVKYQLNPCETITTRCIPSDLYLLQTDMVTQSTSRMF